VEEGTRMRELLASQLTTSVRWEETIRLMQRQGIQYAIEIGPQKVLKQLNRKIARNIQTYAMDVPVDWPSMFKLRDLKPTFIDQCLSIAVSTRNQNNNALEYEKGAIEPYKRLQQIHHEWVQEGVELTYSRKKESLELLEQILICKQVIEVDILNRLTGLTYQLNGEG
jgi:[acyl-carrier-protein] S-malonyltransferase